MILRLGSRGSRLARWQAEHVRSRLERLHEGLRVEIRILRTTGDRILDVPLARIGDKGLFTKEIDRAILDGDVDAAVHSLKDVPTRLDAGLALGAILEREDPRDVFLPAPGRPAALRALPAGARVGTSSLRRRAQLLHQRPDLLVEDLRGNLDTRLARLDEGRLDGAILARAGVRRLGFEDRVGQLLAAPDWLPATGQGALAVAVREDDSETRARVAGLTDEATAAATAAERAFLAALEGGCQIPIGALATIEGDTLRLDGMIAATDGSRMLRGSRAGPAQDAATVGRELADELIGRGATEILDAVRAAADVAFPEASAP